jgi:hypothetical protein
MRSVAVCLCVLALSACAGGARSSAVVPDTNVASAQRMVQETGVGSTLWVGTASAVYAYPKRSSGPAPAPERTIGFRLASGEGGYATAVAPDGTVYESISGNRGVMIYGPWENGGRPAPEEKLKTGGIAALLGQGIATVAETSSSVEGSNLCATATVFMYDYGAGFMPSPRSSLTVPFPCADGSNEAQDFVGLGSANDEVYVYHWNEVQVFDQTATGNAAPLRTLTFPVVYAHLFAVGGDGTIYVASGTLGPPATLIRAFVPGSATASWSIEIPQSGGDVSAIAGDGKGRLFVALQHADGTTEVDAYATTASARGGTPQPLWTLQNPVPVRQTITSLAIGP